MNYSATGHIGSTGDFSDSFMIPHGFRDFVSNGTRIEETETGKQLYLFHGELYDARAERWCECCQREMHINNTFVTKLRHLPFGNALSYVLLTRRQYLCPECGRTRMQNIHFRAEHHMITKQLERYAEELLERGHTNKAVSELTGLAQGTVKDIDKERLRRKYTETNEEGEIHLKLPEEPARFLGIDEFKLHNGYKYATHIIDLETGRILWISHGKKKQVVYDFIDHVGEAWMDHVEAIACDMNSDFQEAFESRCEHIQPVFDYFHIVKNFNDKVVGAVRKDEQKRLDEAGDKEGAAALKKTKYILTSKRSTLQEKDREAEEGKVLARESKLFSQPEVIRHGGYEARYDELLKQNSLLFTLDLVKEQLIAAYAETSETKMASMIDSIIDTCIATNNPHFRWFANLLENHYEGIIAHATYHISSGKIEGINNKIKTLRRQGYGYPDDDYFFLKVIDASYRPYVRNHKSHRVLH